MTRTILLRRSHPNSPLQKGLQEMMAAETLTIDSELLPEAHLGLLTVAGDLDAHTFDQFDEAVQDLLANGCTRLVIDLNFVEYVSSAGVGVLFSALQRIEAQGGEIVLLNPSDAVKSVFSMLGAAPFFRIEVGRLAAIRYCAIGSPSN